MLLDWELKDLVITFFFQLENPSNQAQLTLFHLFFFGNKTDINATAKVWVGKKKMVKDTNPKNGDNP